MQKQGFTLAEVLITIGIIGTVSAITLAVLIPNIQQKIKDEQARSIQHKLTLATERINVNELIGPYNSTMDFVNELKNYLKIIKICDNSNISACWPYSKIDLGNGKVFEVKNATTGINTFNKPNTETKKYSSPNVGIVTADGTPMIISYNQNCQQLDSAKQYAWTTIDGKPVTNATADCVSAVFEINGKKGANHLGDDVRLFNASWLNNVCGNGDTIASCMGKYFIPEPLTMEQCEALLDKGLGINRCVSQNLRWAAGIEKCGGVKKVPTMTQLGELASLIYLDENNKHPNMAGYYNYGNSNGRIYGGIAILDKNSSVYKNLQLGGGIFSNEDSGHSAKSFNFTQNGIFWTHDNSNAGFICLSE